MQPLNNGLQTEQTPNTSKTGYVDAEVLKAYLILQRRALLQSVAADERLIEDADHLIARLATVLTIKTLPAQTISGAVVTKTFTATSDPLPGSTAAPPPLLVMPTVEAPEAVPVGSTVAVSVDGLAPELYVVVDVLKTFLGSVRRNADERRKALLQIVRDTEKRYNIQGKKKRGK